MCYIMCISENKWTKFDVIYYEYGSLVLLYNSPEALARSFNILQNATFDDKQLLVLMLPNILVSITSLTHATHINMLKTTFFYYKKIKDEGILVTIWKYI